MTEQEVILVLDVGGAGDREAMEKHLRREGLAAIEGEPLAYQGTSSTDKLRTLLYLHDGVKKAIRKGGYTACNMIVSIGDEPLESYRYDPRKDAFVLLDTLGYDETNTDPQEGL